MRPIIAAAALLILTGTALSKGDTSKEEEAIKALVKTYVDAFNKADSKAVAATYIEEGTLVNLFGMEMAGRAAIEQQLGAQFAGPLKGAITSITPSKIQLIKPDVAIGDADVEVSGLKSPDGKAIPPVKARGTAVFVKQKGKWLFAATRGYVHLPPPGAPKK